MTRMFTAAAAALAIGAAGAASATTTFDLTSGPTGPSVVFTEGSLSLTLTPNQGEVTIDSGGAGVDEGLFDLNNELDASGGGEFINFVLAGAPIFRLISVSFTDLDGNDDYDIFVGPTQVENEGEAPTFNFDPNTFSSSFRVAADGNLFNAFRVSEVTVAAVPLPAGAMLLLTGLGAMAVARRRSSKA